jgi:hypothetical protein
MSLCHNIFVSSKSATFTSTVFIGLNDSEENTTVYTIQSLMEFSTSVHIIVSAKGTGIAQWYSGGLQAGGSVIRVPAMSGSFSLPHRVQTGS